MYYLLKTEPSVYGFADLQKEQSTIWDGVTNPVAVKNLRNMQKGDKLVIYHTGDEKRAAGTATLVFHPPIDPKHYASREELMEAVREAINSSLPADRQ